MDVLLLLLAILPWRWGDSHFTYSCELEEAFHQWEQYAAITGECSENPEVELVVVDPWPYGDNILGRTGINLKDDGATVHHAYIEVPRTYFLGVLVHEVGHALMLAHAEDPDSAMYRYCCNPINSTDIVNVQTIYGVAIEPQQPALPYRLTLPGVAR